MPLHLSSQWQRNAPWFIQVTPGHGEMPQRSQHVKKSHAHKQGDGDHDFASTPILALTRD